MTTPSITLAQIVGAIMAAILPLLTLCGVDLSAEQVDALDELTSVAMALFGADAGIRIARTFNVAGVLRAKAVQAMAEADVPAAIAKPEGDA